MAIFTKQGVEVEIIGGPYRRFPYSLLGYYETVTVRAVKNYPLPNWSGGWSERPISELKADGGVREIQDAIERLNKD